MAMVVMSGARSEEGTGGKVGNRTQSNGLANDLHQGGPILGIITSLTFSTLWGEAILGGSWATHLRTTPDLGGQEGMSGPRGF